VGLVLGFILWLNPKLLIDFLNSITPKMMVSLALIFVIIQLISEFLNLSILILFIQKRITTPSYLPDYLFNWFNDKQIISNCSTEALRAFIDLYIRSIIFDLVYLLTLIVIYYYL
jgi:ABC-type multidrug transport system permease subunit